MPNSSVIVSAKKQGNPAACASIPTSGNPSNLDGKTKQSIACIKSEISLRRPKNFTCSIMPISCAVFCAASK